MYPNSPKVGNTVRLECWASGNAAPAEKLDYNWDKVDVIFVFAENLDSEWSVCNSLFTPVHDK